MGHWFCFVLFCFGLMELTEFGDGQGTYSPGGWHKHGVEVLHVWRGRAGCEMHGMLLSRIELSRAEWLAQDILPT